VTTEDEARKRAEADFHDKREADRNQMDDAEFLKHYPNKRFYAIARRHSDYLDDFVGQNAPGVDALDYCCGLGASSLRLLRAGARCTGIDISAESVATAKKLAHDNGFAEQSHFEVMDAEALTFDDDSFDLIICSGVLHHLEINAAYRELSRVLRPGGKIIALEALGHNPAIAAYRKLTPKLRTEWEADHILTSSELTLAEDFFGKVTKRYFYLLSVIPISLGGRFGSDKLIKLTDKIDDVLLKVPGIRKMAWQVVFTLEKPIKSL